ncbi:MAG: hypothetical protein Kapaf2KO_03860 [Candidatus Kapaibacteriales bacterium]
MKNIAIRLVSTFTFLIAFFSLSHSQIWVELTGKENPTMEEIQFTFQAYADAKNLSIDDPEYKKFKRWEHFWESRLMDDGTLAPPHVLLGDLNPSIKTFDIKNSATADWQNIGPDTAQGGYSGIGRVNTVAFDPSNSSRFLVGTPVGGIWETTDNAQTWKPLTDRLSIMQPCGVTDIEFAPSNSNIVYAATGDAYGNNTYSLGIHKSTNGGTSWSKTGLDWSFTNFRTIRSIEVHPTDANKVVAATSNGVYISTDGGSNWSRTLNNGTWDINFKTDNANTLFASTNNSIFRSTDGGQSWTQLTTGLPTANSLRRVELAVTEDDGDYVYALYGNNRNLYGVYRTTDGGDNWSLVHNSTNLLGYNSDGSDTGGQAWYDLAIAVSHTDRDEVLVGGVNVHLSNDGGQNWDAVGTWTGHSSYNKNGSFVIHADQHSLEYRSGTSTAYACNDGGIYSTTNSGTTWNWLAEGLSITQFYDFDVQPINDEIFIGGTQDNGTKLLKEDDKWYNPIGGDGFVSHVAHDNDDYMFGELYYGEISGSGNGGNSWGKLSHVWDNNQSDWVNKMNETGAWETPYILNPKKSSTILVGWKNVYRSHNYLTENTYEKLTNYTHNNTIRTLEMSEADTNRIIFSFRSNNTNTIRRTTDGGTTWSDISTPSNQNLEKIVFHPTNSNEFWLLFGGYSSSQKVYHTTNYGDSFTNVSSGLPNFPILTGDFQKNAANRIWIGNSHGVYYMDDDNNQWTEFSDKLPYSTIQTVIVDEQNGMLYAGTYGRGIWKTDLPVLVEKPILLTPENNAEFLPRDTTLSWELSGGADSYILEVSTDNGFSNIVANENSFIPTSYDISGLDYYTIYYWRVKATKSGTESEWSDVFQFSTNTAPPVLIAPPNANTGVDLDTLFTWQPVDGAQGYQLQIDNDQGFPSPLHNSPVLNVTEYSTNTFLIAFSMRYNWRVRSINSGPNGGSEWSQPFYFKTRLPEPALRYPINDTSDVPVPTQFRFTSVMDADSYLIQISDSQDMTSNVQEFSNLTDTFSLVSSLVTAKQYYWRVKSFNTEGDSRWSSVGSFRTLISTPRLIAPSDSAKGANSQQLAFRWTSDIGSVRDSFEIFRDENLTDLVTTRSTVDTTVSISGLDGGSTYFWRVASYDGTNWSSWAEPFQFTTRLEGFSQISPLDGAVGEAISGDLEWAESNGAMSYQLQLSDVPDFTTTIIDTSGLQQLSLNYTLEYGKQYYWRVRATTGQVISDWTSTWSFKTINEKLELQLPVNAESSLAKTTTLVWEEIPGAVYNLRVTPQGQTTPVIDLSAHPTNTYEFTFAYGNIYDWSVSYSIAGNPSENSDIWSFSIMAKPGNVVITFPENGNLNNDITFEAEWTEVQGADFYELEVIDPAALTPIIQEGNITGNNFNIAGLLFNTDYEIRVRASVNGEYGDWAKTGFGTTIPDPILLKPVDNGTLKLPLDLFNWTSVDGADNYVITLFRDLAGSDIALSESTTDTFNLPANINQQGKGDYYWQVKATNANGRVSLSEISKFTLDTESSVLPSLTTEFGLKLYPNPNTGSFTVESEKVINSIVGIRVYDIQGLLVYSEDLSPNDLLTSKTFELKHLTNGNYAVWIDAGAKSDYFELQIRK